MNIDGEEDLLQSSSIKPPQASLMESFGPSLADLQQSSGGLAESSNIGEIHSLYQDLFLTDIKQDVEKA